MPAGLAVPVSGPFLGSWDAQSLGVQNDDGYVLSYTMHAQPMDSTDQYGRTLIEGVYQGGDWRSRLRGLEWTDGLLAALLTFGQLSQAESLAPTLTGLTLANIPTVNVGDLLTNYAGPLILTAVLGNPPTSPQSLVASNAVLPPEFNTETMLTSKIRELPVEFALIPYRTTIGSHSVAIPFSTI